MSGVTIVVTVHTPRIRSGLLARSLDSVWRQTHLPDAVAIACDHYRQGAAVTRNKALCMANTEWVVFLDSDDVLYPHYLRRVFEEQEESKADVVWPWFDVLGADDPFPEFRGKQWTDDSRHIFPITTLVRRELAMDVGGFPMQDPAGKWCLGEDYPFWNRLWDAGAKFHHFPEKLWEWNHKPQGGNTSGMPNRW